MSCEQTHGTPPRRSYHDRQWAAKMKEIGLQPSTTGEPGGKETGQTVTHYIVKGGAFAQADRQAQGHGLSAPLAIGPGRKNGEGEESQQDEIHLPGLWTERLGKAGRAVNLRHLLRRRRGRYLREVLSAVEDAFDKHRICRDDERDGDAALYSVSRNPGSKSSRRVPRRGKCRQPIAEFDDAADISISALCARVLGYGTVQSVDVARGKWCEDDLHKVSLFSLAARRAWTRSRIASTGTPFEGSARYS